MPADLLELFAMWAAHHPDAVACTDEIRTLTYRELADEADFGVARLRAAGVLPGDTVGLFLTPTVALVAATWSVLRSGAAYLPLAIDYPAERVAHMAADAGVGVVLTDGDTDRQARRILPAGIRTIRVDAGPDEDNRVHRRDSVGITGVSAAYTIYTSGTTGTPKGVVIPHRAITNQMCWLADELGLGPGQRILLKTPVAFDAAQWELLANACGATVVVAPTGTHTNPVGLLARVLRGDITIVQCVPTVWAELTALADLSTATTLRTVVSGGEALPTSVAERLRTALPTARAINLYGPTETTINATWFDFTNADLTGCALVPIGIDVDGCDSIIVDTEGNSVRGRHTGELLIAGVQLANGYHGRFEETAQRFPTLAVDGEPARRRYRTGDLVRRRTDGVLEFVGRDDEQVKINGHRVETNEVRIRIEGHQWVRTAAVVAWVPDSGTAQLAGFIELEPGEAPVMDQDRAGRHHRSKSTRTQVGAQLAELALRTFDRAEQIPLPGADAGVEQRRRVFARKSYRTFAGPPVHLEAIAAALRSAAAFESPCGAPYPVTATTLGTLLRWLGPFHSGERLLPKYFYASPGALNATQIYLELSGIPGLTAGIYYFHPKQHALYRVGQGSRTGLRLHLVGLERVIQSVYSTNVREVLQFEAGHIVGVLDEIAAEYGWHIHPVSPGAVSGIAAEGIVTASVALGPDVTPEVDRTPVPALVQVHGAVADPDVRPGLYRFTGSELMYLSAEKVERRHVIAINQRAYELSSLGVVLCVSPATGWDGFTALGRRLAALQQVGARIGIGFMSAGYASLTGRDLPSALRIDEITGIRSLSYFALAGPVSAAQLASTDMTEDAVHMKGPEELLTDDLRAVLPHHMVPPTIHIVDRIPLSSNGKQDRAALAHWAVELNRRDARPVDPPASDLEREVALVWSTVLGYEPVYRGDDFFAEGGNSLSALRLIRELDQRVGVALPVQTVFGAPTLAELAATVAVARTATDRSQPRLLRLAGSANAETMTVLWPGLGGYPMSLRTLAKEFARDGQFVYGMQARGVNVGELPHDELDALVGDDLDELLALGHTGPFRIVGYSFGARVAAEVAQRLVDTGYMVEQLVLLAPGSPVIAEVTGSTEEVRYDNAYYKRVLASVFSGRLDPPYVAALDTEVGNRSEFIDVVAANETAYGREVIERIVRVVEQTYRFRTEACAVDQELLNRSLILRARGDGPSFADIPVAPLRLRTGRVSNLPYFHYEIVTAGALDIAAAALEESMDRELV